MCMILIHKVLKNVLFEQCCVFLKVLYSTSLRKKHGLLPVFPIYKYVVAVAFWTKIIQNDHLALHTGIIIALL
jgi:hypothetical protein